MEEKLSSIRVFIAFCRCWLQIDHFDELIFVSKNIWRKPL